MKRRSHYSRSDIFVTDTANLLDAKLITKDTKIKVSKEVEVVW